jgi:hypothetical protein
MRVPAFLLFIVMALFAGRAYGDARSDAKMHYQAGVKAYSAQDYRTAIKEFTAAQSLMPADLNNYNLALCYDKLGEAEPAIQYYKDYLAKVPNADKRTEIEASISRLESALQSAAAKRAEEQRKADEAKAAQEAARKAEEAKQAEAAKKAADEEAKKNPPVEDPNATTPPLTGVGSTGTPGTGQAVSTGDVQLDRVSAIDVNQIRAERLGGGASGVAGAQAPQGPAGPAGAMGPQGGPTPTNASGPATPAPDANAVSDKPVKKETPVYKKWWFWAVVAVSVYVVISIATDGSSSPNRARESTMLPPGTTAADPNGGMTLLRF